MLDFSKIEEKWQSRWFTEEVHIAKLGPQKKYFIHFAYPGISGYLHVGHMRGFTYADIIARFKKMSGYNVCFPAGFHASGLPAISLAKRVARKNKQTIGYLKENGCPPEIIPTLSNTNAVIDYFSQVYVEDYWKKFGFLIDYSRLMTTISPGYQKFIEWQFKKLNEKKLLIQKPHFAPFCPNCGPVAVDKSETDISQGGNAEVLEFTLIKFRMDDLVLPAATLRPETVFGVTNIWINPTVEYTKIRVNGEKWIVSKDAVKKLSAQIENIQITNETIPGNKLIGKKCTVPLLDREVPLLPATFTDPKIATGIVMSVPAHAPYDYVALKESKENIQPRAIIDIKGYTIPAEGICKKMGIKSQKDTEKLDKATEEIYKKEFHQGVLNKKCGKYAGIKVSEIKDRVKNNLLDTNKGGIMMEFSEQVQCRCGETVIIKKIPDQWFIKYSDKDLTLKSKHHVSTMNIYPQEYKEELQKVLDWFDDRACIRKGSWLGTGFPFKKSWIIEPISDSTLYPAYYTLSQYVNQKKIKADEMTPEFFDFVFLGKGTPKKQIWNEIKKSYDYWYPVDINLGGKEHKTVHFPVFIMNHVALLPPQKWPRGIFVNWWITQTSGIKISKSKGGAEPIPGAVHRYGVDPLRLYYAHVCSAHVDIEWEEKTLEQYKRKIIKIWRFVHNLLEIKGTAESIDEWLSVSINAEINYINKELENYHLREAATHIYFEINKILQWYIRRGGKNHDLLRSIITTWLRTMAPFTPHIAEEIWEKMGNTGFVSTETYPRYNPALSNQKVLTKENLLIQVIDDISEILEVTKIKPSRIYLHTSPPWKWTMATMACDLKEKGKLTISNLLNTFFARPDLKQHAQEASRFAQKMYRIMQNPTAMEVYQQEINEKSYLQETKGFIKNMVNAPQIDIYNAGDDKAPDPGNKKKVAEPLRPAIYLE